MELLNKISQKAKGLKILIEADGVAEEDIHSAVHNSVNQLIQLIRKDMTEQEFNAVIASSGSTPQTYY